MAESYSDEHVLAMYIGVLAEDDRVWVKTARRLMRERDEARRVAKVLAQRTTASQHDWAEVMTALDYPEVKRP